MKAAPAGMGASAMKQAGLEVDTNPTWVPAFCWGIAFKDVAPPFFKKGMDLTVSAFLCWGMTYGTGFGISGSIPGWEVTGIVHWKKSIFGIKPFPKRNSECMFCWKNFPGGAIMFCRVVNLGKKEIPTYVAPGAFSVLRMEIKGKICLSLGVERDSQNLDKNNIVIMPMGGLEFKASYMRHEIIATALGTGTLRIKGFTFSPFGHYDGFTFQLGFWGAMYYNSRKFCEVTIGLSEEWEVTVEDIKNFFNATKEAANSAVEWNLFGAGKWANAKPWR